MLASILEASGFFLRCADPQSGEPEASMITLSGDVNPIDSGDGEEVQEG